MSTEAMSWALNNSAVRNPTSKLVLIALANHARPDGTASFPSISTMQRYTCLSDRAIQKHLRELEKDGVIKRCLPEIVAAHINRQDRRPTGYNLMLDGVNVAPERGEPCSPGDTHGVNVVRLRGERRSGTGGTTFTRTIHEPSNEPREHTLRAGAKKTTIQDGFTISGDVRAWAQSNGYGLLEEHLDAFCLKAQANGYQYANWDAAFKCAIRDDWAKLRQEKNPATGGQRPGKLTNQATGENHATRDRDYPENQAANGSGTRSANHATVEYL